MYVIPDVMTTAASDLSAIATDVSAAHVAATGPTTAIVPAAADEVSAAVAALFSQHAATYQALAGQAAAFHDQCVGNLTAGAASYVHAEAANVSALGSLTNGVSPLLWVVQTLENSVLGPILTPLFAIAGISLFVGFLLTLFVLASFAGQSGL